MIEKDLTAQNDNSFLFNGNKIVINERAIVLDVDGVLLSFDDGYINVARKIIGSHVIKASNEYALTKRYNITDEQNQKVWDALNNGEMGNLPMYKGADIAFKKLQDAGYDIHLVTGIWEESKDMRLENLSRFGMIPKTIDCVGTGRSKKDLAIAQYSPKYFVDDRLEHINDALFVPNRVWVDLNDQQFGLTPNNVTFTTSSFANWVENSNVLKVNFENDIQAPRARMRMR